MAKASQEVMQKGREIFNTGKVEKEVETAKRIHFKVQGETEEHSVIYDKGKKTFECDCRYASLKAGMCSHIYACMMKEKMIKE